MTWRRASSWLWRPTRRTQARAANNLGVTCWIRGDVARWRELLAESERQARRVGDATTIRWAQYSTILENLQTGRWDDALGERGRLHRDVRVRATSLPRDRGS